MTFNFEVQVFLFVCSALSCGGGVGGGGGGGGGLFGWQAPLCF